jgi:glycosyltransferase involved in cell wall biosynthesis
MRIAFYAPLKSPDHPIPSGDRRVAQLFLAALRTAGHDVFVASRFRSYEGRGDPARQARLASLGARLAERFLTRSRAKPETAPDLWFTYHLYHKAPDWLGPGIAASLAIPYVIAEASDAPKQASRAWASGRQAAERAIRQADAVIGLNPADRACVLPLLRNPWRWIPLKPFIDAASYSPQARASGQPARLITVAMMRYGDKLASYQILGEALAGLLDLPWSLEVVGDGPARRNVERALCPVRERVSWAGAIGATAVAVRLAAADLYVWPAINEAFGMALLEAQASGLPVVAGGGAGIGEIVMPGVTGLLVAPGDASAFSAAVRSLIVDVGRRAAFAEAAWQRVGAEHDVSIAGRRLDAVIASLQKPPVRSATRGLA